MPNPESTPPVTTTYFISSTGSESLAHPLSTLAHKFLFRPSLISSIVRITATHVGRTRGRILVTGALGQIGTDLVQALRREHGIDSVIASDIRESDGHSSIEEGPYVPLDVMDTDAISAICKREGIGTVYHLAALLSAIGERNPDKCRRINVGGTISVLEAARECSLRVYAPSSIAVFGPDAPKNPPQDAPLNPTTVYGETKVSGEALARNTDEVTESTLGD